jgi:hypothetical protein
MMVDATNVAHVAVTVLYDGNVTVAVASPGKISPQAIKSILQMGIDDVTRQMVLYEEQRKKQDAIPPMPNPDVPDTVPEPDTAGDKGD